MNYAPIESASARTSLQAELDCVDSRLAELDLYEFVKQAWPTIEPGHPFVDNWHLELICEKLQAVTERKIKRLIINVPPRSGKSTIVSALWPVWTWLSDPSHQWLTISHSGKFAMRDALKSRRVIQSPWFQARWANRFQLTSDQNQKTRYENDQRGYRIAMGITSGITGEGGDTILIDDPMDREAAHSELERERANTIHDEVISTRLNDPGTGAMVVIMQRLHELDTTGHILTAETGWEHLCLPLEYEPDHPHVCDDDIRTEPGEPLWPERYTPEFVERRRVHRYSFAGQYQQRPSPSGGGIWRDDSIQPCAIVNGSVIVGSRRIPLAGLHRFNVADLAYSQRETADYTVVGHFAGDTRTGELYLTGLFRARIDVLNSVEGREHRFYLAAERAKANASYTVVEKAGMASRVIELAQREGEPLREVLADRDKVARAHAALPLAEAGKLFSPRDTSWWPNLVSELTTFPHGAHDDQADVLAYGCIHWREITTASAGAITLNPGAFARGSVH